MSEPALFVLIRDGKKNYYGDRWAGAFLFREIFWGPEELEKWATQLTQLDEWIDDFSAAAVVDFDQRRLIWTGDDGQLNIPKVASLYNLLLKSSWPDYEIQVATTGLPEIAKAAGIPRAEDYDSEHATRIETIREAASQSDGDDGADEEEEDDNDDESGEVFDEQPRAWLTMIDAKGAVRHRQLMSLSQDLLGAKEGVWEEAIRLDAAEVPAEKFVTEGMWIDQKRREVGLWGGAQMQLELPKVKAAWRDWSVRWADEGYEDQCGVSGPSGVPLSDTDSLAQFLPTILSTKRFDIQNMIGAVGGELKKTAMKFTGCLLVVICLPVLLFGVFSGNWKPVLITIGVMTALVIAVFKFLEFRLKRSFTSQLAPLRKDAEETAPVAGPLEEAERRARIDKLLTSNGFPPLAKIEPRFPKDNALDLLE